MTRRLNPGPGWVLARRSNASTALHHLKTADEVLLAIDGWAKRSRNNGIFGPSHQEDRMLWDVLTAMRGPDMPDMEEKKMQTTGVLRHLALPTLSMGLTSRAPLSKARDVLDAVYVNEKTEHWVRHVSEAIHALEHMNRTGK